MNIYKLHNDFNFVLGDIDGSYNYTSSINSFYKPHRTDLLPIVLKIGSDSTIHVEMYPGDIIYLEKYGESDKYYILCKIQRDILIDLMFY